MRNKYNVFARHARTRDQALANETKRVVRRLALLVIPRAMLDIAQNSNSTVTVTGRPARLNISS